MSKVPRRHKLFWQSSYDRGLDVLLELWHRIREKYPDATLDITYGWDFFDKFQPQDSVHVLEWKSRVQDLMKQPGITHHGRVGKEELSRLRKQCGILAYPTYFSEIFMIGAMEAQAQGLVPVTMKLAALPETVKGGLLVEGDITTGAGRAVWIEALYRVMGNEEKWQELSSKGKEHAKEYSWEKIAKKWDKEFKKIVKHEPLITIYTPTVRDGWWNVMASNIAGQTYKNVEWLIVDDKPGDRGKVAEKYAKEYGLNICYMKGKKRKKRTYSLCNANNTAIEAAKGELFVFLQDFVLMPMTGIEQLVVASRRYPRDFIASVDMYFEPKVIPNTKNKEDWFDGSYDIVGEFMRNNVRIQNKGIRKSMKLTDFEHNYGAVPTATLRDLGGYWEFFDEALGWDDTEIIYRAFEKGYSLWVDDRNIASCIDHEGTLGKDEGGKSVNRMRRRNDPRYLWMVKQIEAGRLPVVRKQKIDDKIDLQYAIPKNIKDDNCLDWVKQNQGKILKKWEKVLD